ncbi:ECF-type sigma factor [Paludibaculum fermentans]|uniref:Sigma-70 family RNA polymerase sigma factor n=1 Tax=Paludibaculum fermentans TaxID=1473598 RepID=A0A7S7NL63_PALFE|nr:ECF-type sigma factor [Paludibaculum fermentans]QOY85662.1 sigma-70 family RNA polymerase sigma factor [Paludibaculum fermentans]
MPDTAEPRNTLDDQLPLVYEELRRLAASYLRRERTDHTLQPTSLVHEAYLRLLEQRQTGWSNRAQLIGLAASMMRRILVNYACAHDALKRGGGALRMSIDEPDSSDPASKPPSTVDLLALDQALDQLALFHPECARIVEMKYFGGLNFEEVAEVLGITERTVQRHWRTARAWLFSRLST